MNFLKNRTSCHFIESTDSTNLLINKIIENYKDKGSHLSDFFYVATNYQTAGKGQGKKEWMSNKGENILASFYFQPSILPKEQIYFNYFFALTIRKVLSQYVENIAIKKPNDIYAGDKKIAGILIEHHIQGEVLNYSVAGVGINVNQTKFDPSLPNPISLKLILKKTLSREKILKEIVKIGKEYYNKLQNGAFIELENEYESYVKIFKIEKESD